MSNRYTARRYTHAGQTLRLSEWAARAGMHPSTLRRRIHKYGHPISQALSEPARPGRKRGFRPTRQQGSRVIAVSIESVLRSWGRA